ncbi:MAG: DAK2 domain-containing protein [Chloroflexi bacterium]|nr:DAK2 domain-containing protein [Chloroflexota bacterium]MBU1746565.1 DAK2 domain-containing protein [Chloroflexota bacterium]
MTNPPRSERQRDGANHERSPVRRGPRLCNGQGLRRMIMAGTAWLEQNVAPINALNVFPVPDGDTGTNMFLTMQAAVHEITDSPEHAVSSIAHKVAHGSLMGARGNSGVILSQFFRGIDKALEDKASFTASDLAAAMTEGSVTAYKGVLKPVEGTILTVAREAAAAAQIAAAESKDLRYLLERTVEAARASVIHTPELLPVLKSAGVVDAGGQGLFIILEGMLHYWRGDTLEQAGAALAEAVGRLHAHEESYGYDIQFILRGRGLDVAAIRAHIDSLGDSTLVVGDSSLIKVHVHSPTPGAVLDYGVSQGSISKIIVENLQEQYQEFMAHQSLASVAEEVTDIATVAVVAGKGLNEIFGTLGVNAIVPGGQTMNPSTEQMLQIVNQLTKDQVIILPNNKNIIMVAQQVQQISAKRVVVIPTQTVPQGISALLAFKYDADLETNAAAMQAAIDLVETAEVTRAVRSVNIDGLEVQEGQIIGLLNGRLVTAGTDQEVIALDLLTRMGSAEREIITVYYGDTVDRPQAEQLAAVIQEQYPDQEVELLEGGQPHYCYIISAE